MNIQTHSIYWGLALTFTGLEVFFRFSTVAPLKLAATALVGLAILALSHVRPGGISIPFVYTALSGYLVTACLRFPGLFKDPWEWSFEALLFVSKLSGMFVLLWVLTHFVRRCLWSRVPTIPVSLVAE